MSQVILEPEIESRIIGKGMQAFRRLSNSQQNTIVEFLEENRRQTLMSPLDVINAYLTWKGIIGYTDSIVNLVLQAYNADIRSNMKIIITITDISPNDAFYNDRDKYIGQKWEIEASSLKPWPNGWFAFCNDERNPDFVIFHEFDFTI